jgi:hypothetical protein
VAGWHKLLSEFPDFKSILSSLVNSWWAAEQGGIFRRVSGKENLGSTEIAYLESRDCQPVSSAFNSLACGMSCHSTSRGMDVPMSSFQKEVFRHVANGHAIPLLATLDTSSIGSAA